MKQDYLHQANLTLLRLQLNEWIPFGFKTFHYTARTTAMSQLPDYYEIKECTLIK
jgi:hypothetical protein